MHDHLIQALVLYLKNNYQTYDTSIRILEFFSEKIPGLRWESNPCTPPQLQCDALPVELLSSWEQGGGERGSSVYE